MKPAGYLKKKKNNIDKPIAKTEQGKKKCERTYYKYQERKTLVTYRHIVSACSWILRLFYIISLHSGLAHIAFKLFFNNFPCSYSIYL